METLTINQKEELLELLYIRLDTIKDDPESADEFETERSLTILEEKIKNNKPFTQREIDWMIAEATNREDDIAAMKKILKKLNPAPPKIELDVMTIRPIEKIWTDEKSGYTQQFKYNDGGRLEAGYKGHTGDCVVRAVCNASGLPYQQVYDTLAMGNATQKKTKRGSRRTGQKTASHGINVKRKWFQDYMQSLGFKWVPTMFVGQGCKVHLRGDELPKGRLVVSVSKHYTTMIDGVLHDTYDCSRQGTRAVYGYFIKQ